MSASARCSCAAFHSEQSQYEQPEIDVEVHNMYLQTANCNFPFVNRKCPSILTAIVRTMLQGDELVVRLAGNYVQSSSCSRNVRSTFLLNSLQACCTCEHAQWFLRCELTNRKLTRSKKRKRRKRSGSNRQQHSQIFYIFKLLVLVEY